MKTPYNQIVAVQAFMGIYSKDKLSNKDMFQFEGDFEKNKGDKE